MRRYRRLNRAARLAARGNVVVLPKPDTNSTKPAIEIRVAVHVATHAEWEVRPDAEAHRSHDGIEHVEVVVHVQLRRRTLDDPIVIAAGRGVLRLEGDAGAFGALSTATPTLPGSCLVLSRPRDVSSGYG